MKNRWEVLIDLLKNEKHAKGAEIGVLKGVTSKQLLINLPNLKTLFLVDPWKGDPAFLSTLDDKRNIKRFNYEKLFNEVKKMIQNGGYQNKTKIMRMTSQQAASQIKDGELDWVFIDGNHSYNFVKQDIELWTPKVKIGGWIIGHDYADDCWDRADVMKAVDETFEEFGVEDTVWYVKKTS